MRTFEQVEARYRAMELSVHAIDQMMAILRDKGRLIVLDSQGEVLEVVRKTGEGQYTIAVAR